MIHHPAATMHTMKFAARLATIAVCLLGAACNSPAPASGRIASEITHDVAEGTWALTDSQNSLFNVNLLHDGTAVSNWSKGPDGALGERGTWMIEDGVLVMRWSDGWLDVVQLGQIGFEKYSYAPHADRRGIPTSFGQAIKVLDGSAPWAGVWRTRSPDPQSKGRPLYLSIQSNGAVFKSSGAISTGCWQQQQDAVAIFFSDGWFMSLSRDGENVESRSWAPGAPRSGTPFTAPAAQVLE
jgi:hypothetical protein